MGEPKAITYKEVKKANETGSVDIWQKIGEITGAGHVPASDEASIDLTDVSDSKRARIDKLVSGSTDEDQPETPAKSTKKEGVK